MNTKPAPVDLEKPFSPLIFVITVLSTFAIYIAVVALLFPNSLHLTSGGWWVSYVLVFVGMSLVNGFMEGFFHVFVLHLPLISIFKSFFHKHHVIHHHTHTPVTSIPIEGDSIAVRVMSRYYIIEPEQHEASSFPSYTCAGFLAFASMLTVWFQFMFPNAPILFGVGTAVVSSLVFYELTHAAFHKPIDWWYPKLRHWFFGKFWTRIYGHHLNHHVNHLTNYNVFGFFTFPVFDMAFGTRVKNTDLFIHGTKVSSEAFKAPQPFWAFRLLRWFATWKLRLDRKLQ